MMNVTEIFGFMAQAAPAAAGSGAPGGGLTSMIMMMGVIFIVFYFLIIRPANKDKQRQQSIRDSVKSGDKVITIGGIHGKVTGVDTTNDTIAVKVDTNTVIHFSKHAIATVITKEEDAK